MGKYGSGVDMKTMMALELKEIQKTLDEYDMLDDDKKKITDAYKEVCYQWCQSNAFACLTEEVVKQLLDPEHRMKMQKLMLQLSIGYVEKKMDDTYPWADEEDAEEDIDSDMWEGEEYADD